MQAKALENLDAEILLVDSRTSDPDAMLKKHIEQTKLVIISTIIKYTSITIVKQIKDGFITAEKIKEQADIPVIWTGLAATIIPHHILKDKHSDFLIQGPSEKSLMQFLTSYFKGEDYTQTPNLGYKSGNKDILNKYEYHNAWESWGDFNPEILNMEKYIDTNTLDYIATTGCINDCTFCTVPVIYKRKWKHNSINNITRHLSYYFNRFPSLNHIHFRDDNFFVNKTFVFNLINELKKKNLSITWSAQTSVNVLENYSFEELQALKKAGCNNISIGIESGDPEILKHYTKSKTDLTKNKKIIRRIINSGISTSVTSIISFPDNNQRDFNKTLKHLMKLKLLNPKISMYCTVFQPIPGTKAFNEIYAGKKVLNKSLFFNIWTTQKQKDKLKKFERLYFVFDDSRFHQNLPPIIGKKLKLINRFFSPFIKLRFHLG
ncbi:MAG: radical SAM protein, partial [Candidatus Delongbacteria bacterium]|nr:radical SAM protein [Candidatus Delongbacteria bacterium]